MRTISRLLCGAALLMVCTGGSKVEAEEQPLELPLGIEDTGVFAESPLKESALSLQPRAIQTGTWGTCQWSFDSSTGTLTIGKGSLLNDSYRTAPWRNNKLISKDIIKTIVFSEKVTAPKDCESLFSGFKKLERIENGSNFDVSQTTTMFYMFNGCNSLTSIDVSNWNTSNVTDMSTMFYLCESLTSINVNNWDTSHVKTMGGLFADCYSMESLDISNWSFESLGTASYHQLRLPDALKELTVGPDFARIAKKAFFYPQNNGPTYTGRWIGVTENNKGIIYTSEKDFLNKFTAGQAGTIIAENSAVDIQVKDTTIYEGTNWTPGDNFVSAKDMGGQPLTVDQVTIDKPSNFHSDKVAVGTYRVTYKVPYRTNGYYYKEAVATITVQPKPVDATLKVQFVNEAGTVFPSTDVVIKGKVDDTVDLSAHQEIRQRLQTLQTAGYAVTNRPENEQSFRLTDPTMTAMYRLTGQVRLTAAPTSFDFGTVRYTGEKTQVPANVTGALTVDDTRANRTSGWTIQAKLTQPFTAVTKEVLPKALRYVHNGQEKVLSTDAQSVYTSTNGAQGTTVVTDNWQGAPAPEGLQFQLDTNEAVPLGTYTAQILWLVSPGTP